MITTTLKKAALYARFSSDMQHETSIEAQKAAIAKYAEDNEFEIVAEYIDRAKSGTSTDKRTGFNQMIKDSADKQFQYVIVHKLDRFARDRYDSAIAKHELKRNDVKVLSVLEPIDESPESVIFEALLEAMAEYYSKNLGREVMKGFLVRAGKCLHNGGKPPLGYDVDEVTKQLVINESEAQTVRKIFDLYVQGNGYGTIIKELNSLGYRTKRNAEFDKNSLYSILRNEKYTGYYIYNQWDGKHNRHKRKPDNEVIKIKGGVPAIISEEQFVKAGEIMASHKKAPGANNAKHVYLLSGLVKCGHCGCNMTGNARINGKGYNYRTYRCEHRKSTECANREIRSDKLDEFVMFQLEKYIFREENIPEILSEVRKKCEKRYTNRDKEINDLKNKLNGIRLKQKNIVNAISDGQYSKLLMDRLKQLENDEELVTKHIEELKNSGGEALVSEEELRSAIQKFSQFVCNRNIPECKRFIRDFVEQVTVYNDRVEVTLRVTSDFLCGAEYSVTKSMGRNFLPEPKQICR